MMTMCVTLRGGDGGDDDWRARSCVGCEYCGGGGGAGGGVEGSAGAALLFARSGDAWHVSRLVWRRERRGRARRLRLMRAGVRVLLALYARAYTPTRSTSFCVIWLSASSISGSQSPEKPQAVRLARGTTGMGLSFGLQVNRQGMALR